MPTNTFQIRPLNLTEEQKNDTKKLVEIEHSMVDITKQFIAKDIETIERETKKITKFADGVKSVLEKIKGSKQEAQKTISQLETQVTDLNNKIKAYEKDVKSNNKQSQYKKEIQASEKTYLAEWQKRIQIASKIGTQNLSKIDIDDRKSKANQVFKWVIITIYGQPENKYYWPNFCQQIFQREQGKDFRQRLGKINASNLRQQQKIKTVDFLTNFKEIQASKELETVKQEVQSIRKVAELFLKCYQISVKIKGLEASIEKSKDQSRQRDQQAMRWKARVQALKDRIQTNAEYLDMMKKIESRLEGKIQSYAEKEFMAKEVIQKLSKNEVIPTLIVDVGEQKRDVCECVLY